jgi:ATP-binding cassette subfamily B protein
LRIGSRHLRNTLAEQVQDWMNTLVHQQAIALDLHFYESPDYYDQLHRASIDAINRPMALLETLGALLQNTITLVAMAGVLLLFAWWMPLVLLLGTLPALVVALRTAWHFHNWRLKRTVDQRRLGQYHYLIATDRAAAEVRLFDLGAYFADAYRQLRGQLRVERLALSRQETVAQLLAGVWGLLTLALLLGWVFWQAILGLFSLGSLAMFYGAMNQGQRLMHNLLDNVGEIYRNLLFLDDLFTFLALRPQVVDPAQPVTVPAGLHNAVALTGVAFHYPGSPRLALTNFHLTIPAGKIVAIVGENGAGKSTLLKLLCRFYDPTAGAITWDGVDLRQMRLADLRRRITVLFQQPALYHDTAANNIRFGDLAGQPTDEMIVAAAHAGSAATIIDKLPEGYETILGKWFGYTDLSVGEWQRIALARAFVRQADLVILDEPTSAMDSWAENAWMARFRDLVAGRAALIITHRFTTAMQADIIHVMAAGQVIESGSHAELLARNGRYAHSWRQQVREGEVVGE